MARMEINRSREMEVLVGVVEKGGFSSAARHLGMTPSAVSKLVARLEARLGVRLFNRSTRKLQLTAEGCSFYERAASILSDIDEAERSARTGEQPAGRVRLNMSASYGAHVLAPILPQFLSLYPQVSLEISYTDAVVDLLAARADLAVRAGPLKTSSLIARKLGASAFVIVGAPDYLASTGMPETIGALEAHERLELDYVRAMAGWRVRDPQTGERCALRPGGRITASDGEALRQLAVNGAGLLRAPRFAVQSDLDAGRLIEVPGYEGEDDVEVFHAVYLGQGGYLPARVRVVLDFLAEHGRVR